MEARREAVERCAVLAEPHMAPETFYDGTPYSATEEQAAEEMRDRIAAAIHKLAEGRRLPKLADLHGIAPDLTDGVDSVEYVRRQRDAEGTK